MKNQLLITILLLASFDAFAKSGTVDFGCSLTYKKKSGGVRTEKSIITKGSVRFNSETEEFVSRGIEIPGDSKVPTGTITVLYDSEVDKVFVEVAIGKKDKRVEVWQAFMGNSSDKDNQLLVKKGKNTTLFCKVTSIGGNMFMN